MSDEYTEALAGFDCALRLDPTNAVAIAGRGRVYRELGRTADALADYQRAIALDLPAVG